MPNLNSIVRCLGSGIGLAVIPDFLCKREIDNGSVKLIWEGSPKLANTLHFAVRKKTMYAEEIEVIKNIFKEVMV